MEGMISKEIIHIQDNYAEIGVCKLTLEACSQRIVTTLLEATHC